MHLLAVFARLAASLFRPPQTRQSSDACVLMYTLSLYVPIIDHFIVVDCNVIISPVLVFALLLDVIYSSCSPSTVLKEQVIITTYCTY